MKTKSKILLLTLCAVALVAASVLGTLAYLTSTDTVTNTFTVGNVQIKLDEAKVNPDGTLVYEQDGKTPVARVKENSYKLLPGHEYTKDPTVTVLEGSESSYIRMLVTINEQADLDAIFAPNGGLRLTEFFGGISSDWTLAKETENSDDTRTYEFRYKETVAAPTADVKLAALFTSITVPGTITGDQLKTIEGLQISVVAQAIQADGFDTAADAWDHF
ncbi:MAG: SipW-dependent-type signal peptide-containing protein [Christensenellales bacterium]